MPLLPVVDEGVVDGVDVEEDDGVDDCVTVFEPPPPQPASRPSANRQHAMIEYLFKEYLA